LTDARASGDDEKELSTERIIFSGRVQGVGFRFTTHRIAAGFAVTGYVKNLSNGTVELVAQGRPEVIDQFVAEISRVMAGNITEIARQPLVGDDPYRGFSIRH